MERIVIVGGGQAAGQAGASLRQEGFEGEVVMICGEAHPPYQRPPLSKEFLAGKVGEDRVWLRPEPFYADQGIEVRRGVTARGIDRAAGTVALGDGSTLAYDQLLLATGSRVRRLSVAGAELEGIAYLRTIEDSERIRAGLSAGSRVVVVGGGYIGLEVAAVATEAGASVTVLEAADRILGRVAPPAISELYTRVHAERGVEIRTGTAVTGFEGEGRVSAVACAGDEPVPADLVVVGIGIVPNVELAEGAGLECRDGILVDEHCRTADPRILAAGDCTRHPSALLGDTVRLESVPNAIEQGRVAAAVMCGKERVYDAEPWFWSDQYDLKLQMAGFSSLAEESVTRGDPDAGAFITFHLRNGAVVAVDALNSIREFLACRKLVATGAVVDPAHLADAAVAVKDLA